MTKLNIGNMRKLFDKLFFKLIVRKVFANKNWEITFYNNTQRASAKHAKLRVEVCIALSTDGWYVDSLVCPRDTLRKRYDLYVGNFILNKVVKHFVEHVLDEDVHVTEWIHRTKSNMRYFEFIENLFTEEYMELF